MKFVVTDLIWVDLMNHLNQFDHHRLIHGKCYFDLLYCHSNFNYFGNFNFETDLVYIFDFLYST